MNQFFETYEVDHELGSSGIGEASDEIAMEIAHELQTGEVSFEASPEEVREIGEILAEVLESELNSEFSTELSNEVLETSAYEVGGFESTPEAWELAQEVPEFAHEGLAEEESQQFFGSIARLVSTGLRSPALARLASGAAQSVMQSLSNNPDEELQGEAALYSPIRRIYPDAMMEHLGHEAAEAQTEDEAAQAFFPLIGLAAAKLMPLALKAAPLAAKLGGKLAAKFGGKLLGKVGGKFATNAARKFGGKLARRLVQRVGNRMFNNFNRSAPHMNRAVQQLTRRLWRNRRTRPMVRTVPTIVRRATLQMARGQLRGRPITPQNAVRALAQQANQVLRQPGLSVNAYRKSRALDGRFHGSGSGTAGRGHAKSGGGCGCGCSQRALPRCSGCGRPLGVAASRMVR